MNQYMIERIDDKSIINEFNTAIVLLEYYQKYIDMDNYYQEDGMEIQQSEGTLTMDGLHDKAKEKLDNQPKKVGFFEKIKNAIKKAIDAVKKFFAKIFRKDTEKEKVETSNAINEMKQSNVSEETFIEELEEAIGDDVEETVDTAEPEPQETPPSNTPQTVDNTVDDSEETPYEQGKSSAEKSAVQNGVPAKQPYETPELSIEKPTVAKGIEKPTVAKGKAKIPKEKRQAVETLCLEWYKTGQCPSRISATVVNLIDQFATAIAKLVNTLQTADVTNLTNPEQLLAGVNRISQQLHSELQKDFELNNRGLSKREANSAFVDARTSKKAAQKLNKSIELLEDTIMKISVEDPQKEKVFSQIFAGMKGPIATAMSAAKMIKETEDLVALSERSIKVVLGNIFGKTRFDRLHGARLKGKKKAKNLANRVDDENQQDLLSRNQKYVAGRIDNKEQQLFRDLDDQVRDVRKKGGKPKRDIDTSTIPTVDNNGLVTHSEEIPADEIPDELRTASENPDNGIDFDDLAAQYDQKPKSFLGKAADGARRAGQKIKDVMTRDITLPRRKASVEG
jgi:hypothetical protein